MTRRTLQPAVLAGALLWPVCAAAAPPIEPWLADRGPGVRTSMFATYVRSGELIVSPFVEGYWDSDFEYKPAELGYGADVDLRGKYRAVEGEIFLAYGIGTRWAVELEAAAIQAKLEKAPDDPSSMPSTLEQSGQGDWQVELDWRAIDETATRPEVFAFLEITPPAHTDALLIGTPDWEYMLVGGLTKGLSWGTWSTRVGVTYTQEDGTTDLGEYALEYQKRVSPHWLVYSGIEGEQDEVELIGEGQWHPSERWFLRANLAYGLTSKATDWAPDIGVVFRFPKH